MNLTASELAKFFGLHPNTVRERLKDLKSTPRKSEKGGRPAHVWPIGPAARAILQTDSERLDASQEIARLNKFRAEREELRLQIDKGELVPVDQVKERVSWYASQAVAILEAIPANLRRASPELSAGDVDVVRREVVRACNRVADLGTNPK